MQADTGKTSMRERLGFPMKKLTTAMQEAKQVNNEKILFHVRIVQIIAITMKIGNQSILFLLLRSRLTNIASLTAAITQTAAPEKAPIKR